MSYQPREFWEKRLSEQFDLRGTGETRLSLAYNRACYQLRREVLDDALRLAGCDPRGRRVLDVGCGTGYWTEYYLSRGAYYTGLDIAATSVERLAARHPQARFVLSDVSEVALAERYDIANVFDVLYHVTDDDRWRRALEHLADALEPGGLLLVTDVFAELPGLAAHNRMRSLARHLEVLAPRGFTVEQLRPTHWLLNHHLGLWRFLNRAPGLLLALDRAALAAGAGMTPDRNKLLVARKRTV